MRRAYRFGRNSGRNEDRRQSNHPYWTSQVWDDCSYGDRRRLNHNRFNSQKQSRTTDDCSQFDRGRSFDDRRSNHRFDFRSRNSRNNSQSLKNRRGW